MSLIRILRDRKQYGSQARAGMKTRTLIVLLVVAIIAIWYMSGRA